MVYYQRKQGGLQVPKLLIIDDDIHLRKLVLTYAELEGFQCEEAEDGEGALLNVREREFDLIILDVMMPGMDGFETLAEIRKHTETPVIMLTSRSEEYDRLLGFNLGADDYVPKPFSPKELMARVGAILKRSGGKSGDKIHFGELRVNPGARTAHLGETPLTLTPKEFELLVKLTQNEGLVLSREQLLQTVWGYDYSGDARTVDTHIKSLRERLGDYRKVIRTVWGVGYKFEYKQEG
jgi:DNA-binding response OmpR family regulator